MVKQKKDYRVVYIVGDINDADYVGKKVVLKDEFFEKAFDYFLKETKKHKGDYGEMDVTNFDPEEVGFYDEEMFEFIPSCNGEEPHTIESIEDISPNKPHKMLFKNMGRY